LSLKVAEKPSREYCMFLRQLIRQAAMSHHNATGRKIHKVGILSKVQHKIVQLDKRGEWPFGKGQYPSDLTIYRRIEEEVEQADFLVSVAKGSGWYCVNPVLFGAPQKESVDE